MRIKKIEITGFKSFSDRTVLTFDAPISGVVGPNGCGKSNVVDAIRWAMGEQSAKHLRGRAMEDVIFNGSDTRGPAGLAEVSLYFENDDGKVPLAYANYSEIVVTRRLFRNGDSDYLINKGPCRLMDITDLFLGTGVGTKAYSIIEQGKVGLIVSSKPEERRTLIEEAAGITKYKTKKKAAEKKMELTRQNLLRVGDILGEVEKSLGSLRRQAQKAERYKQYRTELRDLELCDASQRWLGYLAQEGVRQSEADELTALHEDREASLSSREAAQEAVRLALLEEERRLAAEQERLYELDNRVQLNVSTTEFKSRERQGLLERAEQARGEVGGVEAQLEEAQAELVSSSAAAEQSADRAREVAEQLAVWEARIAELRGSLAELEAGQESLRQKRAQAQADIARAESHARGVELRRTDLANRTLRLAEEQERLGDVVAEEQARVARLGREVAELRQLGLDLGREREDLKTREVALRKELAASEKRIDEARQELSARSSRLLSLTEIAARYEGFEKGPRAVMQRFRPGQGAGGEGDGEGEKTAVGVRALVAETLEAPAELEVALEAVLGDRLGAVVVDGHPSAQAAMAYLAESSQGRATFIPERPRCDPERLVGRTGEGVVGQLRDLVAPRPGFEAVADYLLGQTLVVRDLSAALRLWEDAGRHETIVTLAGEVLDAEGALSGGSREPAAAGVLARRREMRELEAEVSRLEAVVAERRAHHEALRAELTEVRIGLENLVKRSHEGELELRDKQKDHERARAEHDRARARLAQLAEERLQLEDQRAELEREAQHTVEGLELARQALAERDAELEARTAEVLRQRDDLEDASKELMLHKVRDAEVRAERESAERARSRLTESVRELTARRERLRQTIAEGESRSAELAQEVAAAREELEALRAEQTERLGRFTAERQAFEERRAQAAREEAELRTERHALDEIAAKKNQAHLALKTLQMERGYLEQQVEERYRVRLFEHVGDFHLRPLLGDAELERIGQLRELIERMGEINLTAVEEYADAEKRHTFLTAQKRDLEEALDQLETAIAKMNKESRERFKETFDAVNERFQKLFPQLFRGGKAELVLTQPEDMLETGVDIIAQPPGKKPATIDLLSGGEKALTAVSLIFAIFQYKPSPFCILDEVDAPLDEANVGRYNDLIRELAATSQFIIITHNKRTVGIADVLYGVTMEEPGVSKLVSVNMRTDASRPSSARAA